MIDLNGYTSIEKDCKCGNTHSAYTQNILAEEKAIEKLPCVCKEILAEGRIGIVTDAHVKHIAEEAESLLVRAGYRTRIFTICGNSENVKNEASKLTQSSEDIRLWVAVGTGTVCNAVKLACTYRANEWVLVMTAPTTDEMLYPFCNLFENGTFSAESVRPPIAVVADYFIIENAPKYTVAAGYGTLISKLLRAFDFTFDEVTDKGRCRYLTQEFTENLLDFFDSESCEQISLRICRALIRLGIISQLANDSEFMMGGEYYSALCLKMQYGNKRLTGENAALCAFTSYCILKSYLSVSPDDLFIPASLPEYFRYLDKSCGLKAIALLSELKKNSESEAHLYVLKEYSKDLLNNLDTLFRTPNCKAKQFRRLYEDAGYWLGSYCTQKNVLKTVSSAYAAFGNSLLSSIIKSGAMENAL